MRLSALVWMLAGHGSDLMVQPWLRCVPQAERNPKRSATAVSGRFNSLRELIELPGVRWTGRGAAPIQPFRGLPAGRFCCSAALTRGVANILNRVPAKLAYLASGEGSHAFGRRVANVRFEWRVDIQGRS